MEEKNPQSPRGGNGVSQGNRGPEEMGTHGGPAAGSPPEHHGPRDEQFKSHGTQAPADEPDRPGEGVLPSDEDEEEGIAARTMSRVKSIARGLMEKRPDEDRRGPVSQEEINQELAEVAQAEASARARTGQKRPAHKAAAGAKSVRGGRNKADKAGKVGKRAKAGRTAAALGAKKGTRGARGKLKKQQKRPVKTQSRANVRWSAAGPSGGRGQGRGAQKGARGKSGAKRRPSPRKGTK